VTDDDDEFRPGAPVSARNADLARGLAALLIGLALFLGACVLEVFNVLLFRGGMRGIPRDLSIVGGFVGSGGVALLGLFATVRAFRTGFGALAPLAAGVGLIAWLIASINLMMTTTRAISEPV
jgi:hypothetical protein